MPGTSRSNGARSMASSSHSGGRLDRDHRSSAMGGDARADAHRARNSPAAHLHLRLPAEVESVTAAHHCIFGVAAALDPDTVDDIRLLISELVTNAIRHAGLAPGDWIDLVVDVESDLVRVEVRDPGPGFDPGRLPASRQARSGSTGRSGSLGSLGGPLQTGWGLEFLRRIASRWGVRRNGLTSVWFELDLPPFTGGGRPL